MSKTYTQEEVDVITALVAAAAKAEEREAFARMSEDAPPLQEFFKNELGGCAICGFAPKLFAAAIRARGETK